MASSNMGLLVGGLLPALLFSVVAVLQKTCTQLGIGLGPYLAFMGLGVTTAGVVAWCVLPAAPVAPSTGLLPVTMGLLWAGGMAGIATALGRYRVPLSQIAPLYNTNTLFAVLLGLLVYAEWQQVAPLRMLLGAALITGGSVLLLR